MWVVYKHTTPSGKMYFGITHQKPINRWGRNGNGYRSNKHFYNAIQKYGWDNISHEIIAECADQKTAESIERKLIMEFKSYDTRYGYNKALGGHALSNESRKKISETRKERGIVPWTYGKHHSEETKRKISLAHTGLRYKMSEAGRKHLSESKLGEKNPMYGRKKTKEEINRMIRINEKPVVRIDGDTITVYESAKKAGEATGIIPSNITRACRKERSTAGGYKWEYANKI